MITNQEIVDTYLAYKHMKLSGKDYPCKQMLKNVKSRWRESYRKFNADFFKAFNQDQIEFITDQMDEFEDYIHNKMVMLKTTVMGVFSPEASFDEKKILASVLTSNVLSQMAQHVWCDMYRDKWHRPKDNPMVEAVTKNSYEFANHFPVSRGVDLTASDKVSSMISSLCKEVMKFLNMKFHEA